MEDIHRATRRYEEWLGGMIPLVRADLRAKHQRMRLGPFLFMRATFYRWCQLWQAKRKELGDAARAAPVAAVGDLHLENFGTWRDSDGRLIWGINDFDETTTLPWTQDLIRLAASAHLAIFAEHIAVRRRIACEAILEGYRAGVETGGQPYVLEEAHGWLRRVAMGELRHPTTFWEKMNGLRTASDVDRESGGRHHRGDARGGICRSASPAASPGWGASAGRASSGSPPGAADGSRARRRPPRRRPGCGRARRPRGARDAYSAIISRAVRVPDPTVRVVDGWLVRRLAPHCARIEIGDLPSSRDEERLLYAMGFETANVHLGTPRIRETLRKQLAARRGHWLHETAKQLSGEVVRDWRDWRAAGA